MDRTPDLDSPDSHGWLKTEDKVLRPVMMTKGAITGLVKCGCHIAIGVAHASQLSFHVLMPVHEEDFEWQPPSEAELKIIQARRERSDKISKLMGDYLLKGYKMLGNTCDECGTILLQDKQGENYCIACRELDTDTSKDDPVVNTAAARSQILEGTTADEDDTDDLSYMVRQPQATSQSIATQGTSQARVSIPTVTSSGISSQSGSSLESVNLNESYEVLCQKIIWATSELKKTNSVDYSIHLCQLIKASAESIQSLKQIILS